MLSLFSYPHPNELLCYSSSRNLAICTENSSLFRAFSTTPASFSHTFNLGPRKNVILIHGWRCIFKQDLFDWKIRWRVNKNKKNPEGSRNPVITTGRVRTHHKGTSFIGHCHGERSISVVWGRERWERSKYFAAEFSCQRSDWTNNSSCDETTNGIIPYSCIIIIRYSHFRLTFVYSDDTLYFLIWWSSETLVIFIACNKLRLFCAIFAFIVVVCCYLWAVTANVKSGMKRYWLKTREWGSLHTTASHPFD